MKPLKNLFIKASFLTFLILIFGSCESEKTPDGTAHQEAIEMTEAMERTHQGMLAKLDFMKKENQEMVIKMNALESPDSFLVATNLQTQAIITKYEELADAQKELIRQNKRLIKKHAKLPLTTEEIKAQHGQIKINYETVQKQAANILQELEYMKNKHTAVESKI